MTVKDVCPMVNGKEELGEALKANERTIVLFHASWCPFCVKFLPLFQKLALQQERHNFLIVRDDQEKTAAPYSVEVYPTVLYFEKGAVVKRLDGVLGSGLQEQQLAAFVSSLPSPP